MGEIVPFPRDTQCQLRELILRAVREMNTTKREIDDRDVINANLLSRFLVKHGVKVVDQ